MAVDRTTDHYLNYELFKLAQHEILDEVEDLFIQHYKNTEGEFDYPGLVAAFFWNQTKRTGGFWDELDELILEEWILAGGE